MVDMCNECTPHLEKATILFHNEETSRCFDIHHQMDLSAVMHANQSGHHLLKIFILLILVHRGDSPY